MKREIKKVVVLGAGTMGSGIAAHLANAGVEVRMLDDFVPPGATDRAAFARSQIKPASFAFMDPANARLITPGNMDDGLAEALKGADMVIEATSEDLNKKRHLNERLEQHAEPGTIIATNTSSIPLKDLTEGRSENFKKNFIGIHFFNPPRFMRLVELISGDDSDPAIIKDAEEFLDVRLGKTVVKCKDSPAFIANRIGTYFMFRTLAETTGRGMKIEDVDAVLGKPMGFPKDGVFGLIDLVGIGLIPHLIESLQRTLPANDSFRAIDGAAGLKIIDGLLADGRTGRNSPKGGFYRMQKNDDGSKVKQVLDLQSGEYRIPGKGKSAAVLAGKKGLRAVFEAGDDSSKAAWAIMRDTLLYAASLVPTVSDSIADIDTAMRAGYNWKAGPFEMLDKIGHDWFAAKAREDGLDLPPALAMAGKKPFYALQDNKNVHMTFDFDAEKTGYAPIAKKEGTLSLADIKRTSKPLVTHHSASLWDIGDGVTCFELHSKMNTLDASGLHALNESVKFMESNSEKYSGMVLYNDAEHFSLGANIGLVSEGYSFARGKFAKATGLSGILEKGMDKMLENLVYQGQAVYKAMLEAPFPVVGAPRGRALGGGCEILLHCDAIQACAETYTGLVESGLGIMPCFSGNARMLERTFKAQQDGLIPGGSFPPVRQAFMALMMPQLSTSTSAQDAIRKLWFPKGSGITMNPDRLLFDAKQTVLNMAPGYEAPKPAQFRLPGISAAASFKSALDDMYLNGQATSHDVVVADALGNVLSGGDTHIGIPISEEQLCHLERENFMSLVHTEETKARINHTYKTNKPLREGPTSKTLDEIRANRQSITLPYRPMDGKPLEGAEGRTLRRMADATAMVLKLKNLLS